MGADALIGRLHGVQGRGPKWRAICPAHESKHKSRTLSIMETPDGRVLMRCFAGCEVEAIVGAVGMDLADLFPPKPANYSDDKRPPPIRQPWTAREVIQALDIPLTEAFMLLRKIGSGARLSASERERCLIVSDAVSTLSQEISR
jgi:hypothetical protein